MEEENLLDVDLVDSGRPVLESADLGSRFGNAFLDGIAIRILIFILSTDVLSIPYQIAWILPLTGYIAYYLILEYRLGQTVGKMLTGTVVVDEYGNRPSFRQVLLRFLVRHIPLFNALSFFFYKDRRGWHDRWSGTYVVHKSSV